MSEHIIRIAAFAIYALGLQKNTYWHYLRALILLRNVIVLHGALLPGIHQFVGWY